jgi:hypothetical protein
MRVEGIKTHTVVHMWQAYAKDLLADHPKYIGVKQNGNSIENYYIFKADTKSRVVVTQYPSRKIYTKVYSRSGLIFSYPQFRKVVEDYFMKARKEIIKGNAININGVGKICAKRVERDFRNDRHKLIDWSKTRLQPKVYNEELGREVYSKYVYLMGDDWCRIAWFKNMVLTNRCVYEFEPTHSSSISQKVRTQGFTAEFSAALTRDKLLKYQYLFQPLHNGYTKQNKTA